MYILYMKRSLWNVVLRSGVDQHSDVACALQRCSCVRPSGFVHIRLVSHCLAEVCQGVWGVGFDISRHVQHEADQNGSAVARRVRLGPRVAPSSLAVSRAAIPAGLERERRCARAYRADRRRTWSSARSSCCSTASTPSAAVSSRSLAVLPSNPHRTANARRESNSCCVCCAITDAATTATAATAATANATTAAPNARRPYSSGLSKCCWRVSAVRTSGCPSACARHSASAANASGLRPSCISAVPNATPITSKALNSTISLERWCSWIE